MLAQAFQITGAHEKFYIVYISFLVLPLETNYFERKQLSPKVKESFDSQAKNAKIVWKCQIQSKKCRALKILLRHGNTKAGLSFLALKTRLMFEFKCNFVGHGYSFIASLRY